MNQDYDVIVLGTGLTECVIAGLLALKGKKILHIDSNGYLGGENSSLNLTQLFTKFHKGEAPFSDLGGDHDYKIDLVPKFMIANGEFVKILDHTGVTKFLRFKQIAGAYIYKGGRIAKVPATEMDALRSPLMDVLEKRRAKAFLEFVENYSFDNPTTHQGMDIRTTSMETVFKFFHLQPGTADLIGHGLALYFDDSYLTRPALEAFHRITLYMSSAARWGKSPFLYPLYGMGELHQGFARLSELHGGTTILNSKVDEILYEDGRAVGIRCGDEVAKCSQIVCDPSYAPKKVKKTGQVIRVICLLNEPIPCTDDADSLHLIMPQKQLRRQHDIFIAGTSGRHNMCEDNHYLAIVSTVIETDKPEEEIQPGLAILGDIVHKFVHIYDMYEPTDNGTADHVFVSKSYDATSHFETVYFDIKDLYKRIVGRELDIKPKQPQEGAQKECVQCLGNRPVFIHEEIS